MWCCKRLDASDWPVTTIVRGNIFSLHSCCCFLLSTSQSRLLFIPEASSLSRVCFFSLLPRVASLLHLRNPDEQFAYLRINERSTKIDNVHAKRVDRPQIWACSNFELFAKSQCSFYCFLPSRPSMMNFTNIPEIFSFIFFLFLTRLTFILTQLTCSVRKIPMVV